MTINREAYWREAYRFVRNNHPDLYERIAAFASTCTFGKSIWDQDLLPHQANLEKFCIDIVFNASSGEKKNV